MKTQSLVKTLFVLVFLLFPNIVYAQESSVQFFWDEGCTYCEKSKVEITEKQLEEKINIEYIKVSESEENRTLFLDMVQKCNLKTASIPMVVIDEQCFVGYPEAVSSIERKINGEELVTSQEDDKGKASTEILLIGVPAFLLLLVGYGLYIGSKEKGKVKKISMILLSTILISVLSISKTYAICPLCTVAVGAGLGFSRYFGIDDLITSVWVGGILMSFSLMTAEKISLKFKTKWYFSEAISIVLFYAMTFIPFHFMNVTGNELNQIVGIDKIVLGSLIGSISFYLAGKLHLYLKEKNEKVLFPYQKVVLPVTSLWLCSLIFYIILYT